MIEKPGTGRELHWTADGKVFSVRIDALLNHHATFHAGGRAIPFEVVALAESGGRFKVNGRSFTFYVHRNGNTHTVWLNGRTYRLAENETGTLQDGPLAGSLNEISAPMPGKIVRIEASPGDTVSRNQPVITMESMKMESSLGAPKAGRVGHIHCKVGQIVEMGELLATIE